MEKLLFFRRSNTLNILLYLWISITLSACATKVTTISTEEGNELSDGSGYLLIAVDTNQPLHEIYIYGEKKIVLTSTDLKTGSNYILTPLPAGDYRIGRIELYDRYYFKLEKDLWDFQVKPDTTSYVGHLEFQRTGIWTVTARMALVNRATEALKFMEENFADTLVKKNLRWGGPGKDQFFEHVEKYQAKESL